MRALPGGDGTCPICGRAGEKQQVDHCHNGGGPRGLLCGRCNRGLGMFLDSPSLLARAVVYLESHNEQ